MATYQKRGKRIRAIIRKNGITQSKTFSLKKDAEAWAKQIEVAIETQEFQRYHDDLFGDVIRRYLSEVTPTKKSAQRETIHLKKFCRDYPKLLKKAIADIDKSDVANWRDDRLKTVAPLSVNREWNTLSAIFTHCTKVWGMDLPPNPFHQVQRPKNPSPRNQRINSNDLELLLKSFEYCPNNPPKLKKHLVAWAMLFALETGARAGEICKLMPEDVSEKTIILRDTKNGDDRTVPLSLEAKRLLTLIELPLGLDTQKIDALFRKYRPVQLSHLRFHDTRHEALSRMAKKINNPMTLAKISGHKDIKILLNVYYNPDNDDLAGLLD